MPGGGRRARRRGDRNGPISSREEDRRDGNLAPVTPRVLKELGDLCARDRFDHPYYATRIWQGTPVDRKKETPMLLRVFIKEGVHHNPEDFAYDTNERKQLVPSGEIQIYLWRDDTLLSMYKYIRAMRPRHSDRIDCVSIAHVYPTRDCKIAVRPLGRLSLTTNWTRGPLDSYTLEDLLFNSGDMIDIAVNPLPGVGEKPTPTSNEDDGHNEDMKGEGKDENEKENVKDEGIVDESTSMVDQKDEKREPNGGQGSDQSGETREGPNDRMDD